MAGIPNTDKINDFYFCKKCLAECNGNSPVSYQRLSAGRTKIGLQIWCERHNCNVIHLSFNGEELAFNNTQVMESGGKEKKVVINNVTV